MRVKICGITSAEAAHLVGAAGADYAGINFFPPSPRSVSINSAPEIIAALPESVASVALVVDADDALIERLTFLDIDWLQLHGTEPPERVAALKARTGLRIIKVIGVREAADLAAIDRYAGVSDLLLIDAKPPEGATFPGGHGVAFDWRLIAGWDWPLPWMLAGGLTPDNVAEAIRLTGARQVDVASGTESAPGVKDAGKIRAFVAQAKAVA